MKLFNRYDNNGLQDLLLTARVYTRICSDCGAHWLVPHKYAVDRRRSLRRLRREYVAHRNWLSNAKCPSCGSTQYTQHRPDETPLRLAA
jgi:hypothetical protein